MVVQTADWMLAADVITNEQYAEVIRKIFVERLDLDPSGFNHTIYDFLEDEEYHQLKHGVTEEKLEAVYINTLDAKAKEDFLLSAHGHFWSLIGMTGVVFSACASFLVRFTEEAKTVSVFNSRKKPIKTLASIPCGRKNFSFLLQLLFYFGLTDTTQAQVPSGIAWTTQNGLAYKDYCDVDTNNGHLSCLCAKGSTWTLNPYNGKQSFFICDTNCDHEPFRVSGFCAQCKGGTFWGYYYTEGESGYQSSFTLCPTPEMDLPNAGECPNCPWCKCGITTYSPTVLRYFFTYVCSHDAHRYNTWYTEHMAQYYGDNNMGQCTACPAGTYSQQGDIACSPCEPGTYAPNEGMPACLPCPSGTFNSWYGYTYCNECPDGWYTNKATGATECTAPTATLSIEATNTNSRRQLKKKKEEKGSDDETEQAGKSGKSEMMSKMAAGLKELLQPHLEHCGSNTTGIVGNATAALVQIVECKKGTKKKDVACDLNFAIPFTGNETESAAEKTKHAKLCIIAAFQESDGAIKEALTGFFNSCDVRIKEVIAGWKPNSCNLF